jgi:hypothetical protein
MNAISSSKWVVRLTAALLAVICVTLLLFAAEFIWTLRSAQGCFRLVAGLTPGKSSLTDTKQLLRYAAFAHESVPCTRERCSVDFYFESRLSWWHLIAPRRAFQGNIEIRNDAVETIHFFHMEGASMPLSVTVGPTEAPAATPGLALGLSVVALSPERRKSVASVKQFAELPVDSRRETLQPNVWCLVKFGGCQTPQSIIPGTRSLSFEP